MLKLRKIAITGGLASGKTTLCRLFEEKGAYVVYADKIVHELLNPTTELGKKVIELLGPDVVVDGFFDRKKIADSVFNNEGLLAKLEQLLHPKVQKVIETCYQEVSSNQNYSLFVVEIPLLYESNMQHIFDKVITVVADIDICKKRFKWPSEEYERRTKWQMRQSEKAKKADYVIENNGTLDDLKVSFENIYEQLTRV